MIGDIGPQKAFFSAPFSNLPANTIYRILDSVSYEVTEPELFSNLWFYVIIPPLYHDEHFVKGLMYTQAPEVGCDRLPEIQNWFLVTANSGWCSYPFSQKADVYFTVYDNPARLEWFKKANPERSRKQFLPLSFWARLVDEKLFSPDSAVQRDIDLLCVARPCSFKNIPLIGRALVYYKRKFGQRLRMTWVTGVESVEATPEGQSILRALEWELGEVSNYVDILPQQSSAQMADLYRRSRVLVHGSLIEGFPRAFCEAQLCNTPIVCFEEFNEYARGRKVLFHEGSGVACKFGPEPLAYGIHKAMSLPISEQIRARFLEQYGQRNFLRRCLELDYYRDTLPGYSESDPLENEWLRTALHQGHGKTVDRLITRHWFTQDLATFPEFLDRITGKLIDRSASGMVGS